MGILDYVCEVICKLAATGMFVAAACCAFILVFAGLGALFNRSGY